MASDAVEIRALLTRLWPLMRFSDGSQVLAMAEEARVPAKSE